MTVDELLRKALEGKSLYSSVRKIYSDRDIRYSEWDKRLFIKDIPDNVDELISKCNELNNKCQNGDYTIISSLHNVDIITDIQCALLSHNGENILFTDIKGHSLIDFDI